MPVAARRQRVAVLTVIIMMVGVPTPSPHPIDERGRDGVAFDRQRVVGIMLIDFVDKAQIRILVLRQPRRFRKSLDDAFAHRLPHGLHATDNGRCRRAQRPERLLRREGIAFPHVVARALHRLDDLIGNLRPSDAAERSGKVARFR